MSLKSLSLFGITLLLAGCPYMGEQTYIEDIQDFDGDGAIAERFGGTDCRDDDASVVNCDEDGDGENSIAAGGTDCDDTTSAVGTGAREICNGIDDDCDGLIDDVDPSLAPETRLTWYRDADSDTFGDPDNTAEACEPPAGFIAVAGDCDDSRSDVSPGSVEFCDITDHNCDGDETRNAVDMLTYYIDADMDGYGRDQLSTEQGCPGDAPEGTSPTNDDCDDNDAAVNPGAPDTWYDGIDSDCAGDSDYDQDGDGFAYPDEDCDDEDATINPDARELCDGIDNDCDGQRDEVTDVTPFDLTYYYVDADGDGAGGGQPIASCAPTIPPGHVADGGDCDDGNPSVNPGGVEVCDGADNDCNGAIDDSAANRTTYYVDGDGDGFGDVEVLGCVLEDGWSRFDGDCNDGDPTIYPGAFEICGDAAQQDCDLAAAAFDCDGDGVDGAYPGNGNSGADCDDGNPITYPGAPELCDGEDNDCDTGIDNPPTEPVDNFAYYRDLDGDGFGAGPQQFPATCGDAVGMVVNNDDCDDLDAAVFPGAGELCDGIDNNCDDLVDQGLIAEPRRFYLDNDGDSFGDPSAAYARSCSAPQDGRTWVDVGTDCNDVDADISPSADEVCDGIDNDCDALVDDNDNDTLGASWWVDGDEDGFGSGSPVSACTQPAGFVPNSDDCDDARPDINPGIPEDCNGYDDDCDGFVDGADPDVVSNVDWYPDVDGDGYGDENATPVQACIQPVNHVANNFDCDDGAAGVSPAGTEVCDGTDNDCDDRVDDDDTYVVGATVWYTDSDGDGIGTGAPLYACVQPVDGQGSPTAVSTTGDCDDGDAERWPGNLEVCDGKDNDCDGNDDQAEVLPPYGSSDWWADGDGDGYGAGSRVLRCDTGAPATFNDGWADKNGDCNDGEPAVNPGILVEQCDGAGNALDLDCDGLAGTADPDYDGTGGFVYGLDPDGDGYGSSRFLMQSCSLTPPGGYAASTDDCNDLDADIYPGMVWHADADQDGFGDGATTANSPAGTCDPPAGGPWVVDSSDCNDGSGAISPAAPEICDEIDNDCDGLVDDDDDLLAPERFFYEDTDNDGYGDPLARVGTCTNSPPATGGPWSTTGGDCDDTAADVNPEAPEVCGDGVDSDCDGDDDTALNNGNILTDVGGNPQQLYYLDADNDTYLALDGTALCADPTSGDWSLFPGDDCDDTDPTVFPGELLVGATRAVSTLSSLQDRLYNGPICPGSTVVFDAETFEGELYVPGGFGLSGLTFRGAGADTVLQGTQPYDATLSLNEQDILVQDLTILSPVGPGVVLNPDASRATFERVAFGNAATVPSFDLDGTGGALAVYQTADVVVRDSTFHNASAAGGGCIYLSTGSLTLEGVALEGCADTTYGGAAIYQEGGTVIASGVTINGAVASDGSAWRLQGGDVYAEDLTMTNSNGGIWLDGAYGTLIRFEARNISQSVLAVNNVGQVEVSNFRSFGNGGGGNPSVYVGEQSNVILNQATFVQDYQPIFNFANTEVTNALFVDNTSAPYSMGGGFLDQCVSNQQDLSGSGFPFNTIYENEPVTFQTYYYDGAGVNSLPLERLDMSPTGLWNGADFAGATFGFNSATWSYEEDLDNDTLPDAWERRWGNGADLDPGADDDADNLTNFEEYAAGTLPLVPDTDGDLVDDDVDTAPLNAGVQ